MRALWLSLWLAACGDDLDPGRCLPDGFAEGESVVSGQPLGPFARAALVEVTSPTGVTHAIAFDEAPGVCGEVPSTGRRLVLLFCDLPVSRDYIAVRRQQLRCPGDNVLALIEESGGLDVAEASAGTITIADAAGCVRGEYSLQFDADQLGGAFDAVACE